MVLTLYASQEIIARRAKTSERVWSRSYVGVGGLGAAKLASSEMTRVLYRIRVNLRENPNLLEIGRDGTAVLVGDVAHRGTH